MGLEKTFEELHKQSKEDFKFTTIAMDNVTGALRDATQEMAKVKTKMARQEERFELMLQAVQEEIRRVEPAAVDPAVITDLVRRVEALEEKQSPAA